MGELAALVDDWRVDARCREVDTELFFPKVGSPGHAAKRVCAGCPVRLPCLEAALAAEGAAVADARFGIFGGLSGDERHRVYRCRRGQCKHRNGCPEVSA